MNPGDNGTLSLRLATAAPASKGSRFFITRGGHLVGIGTVAKIVR
jgi:translation elongation factor EF-Tu-like GTPase